MPWWSADEVATVSAMRLDALGGPPRDPSNRVADDPRAAALGARLFVDPRLSATGAVSCATCHQPGRGFQDGIPLGRGVGTAARRTMTVVGTAYAPWLFWDGRADSPWAQALGPLESAPEHGGTRALYVRVLATHYRGEYEALFGAMPSLAGVPRDAGPLGTPAERAAWAALPAARRDSVTRAFANLGKVLASYERTLRYPRTRFDDYAAALAAGRRPLAGEILSADEAAGLRLFVGKARCATCHAGPRFTDDQFHNTGVPVPATAAALPIDEGRIVGAERARADPFNCLGAYSDADTARDPAACAELRFIARGARTLVRAYRPPSLRGVAARAPYMHAGQFTTLRAVLAHYNTAPRAPRGTSELRPLGLTTAELTHLERFLDALAPDTTPPRATTDIPSAARQVFEGVMSPFCPELLLANCPSPQADSLRHAIVRRAAAGESRAHIERDLLDTYGDVIRAAPVRQGFGLVAWLTPGLVLAAAALCVGVWIRRRVAGPEPPHEACVAPSIAARHAPNATATADELAALDAMIRRDG